MTKENQTRYAKDPANNKIVVTRRFDAPVEFVWRAWTEQNLLDQWWAPKPWKAKTKSMHFAEGGEWIYAMVGPDGSEIYAKVVFTSIRKNSFYSGNDCFCDASGKIDQSMPVNQWKVNFVQDGECTNVVVEIVFASEADMKKIIEMGFEQGFAMAHDNLDEILSSI